jgi:hypothetical protein
VALPLLARSLLCPPAFATSGLTVGHWFIAGEEPVFHCAKGEQLFITGEIVVFGPQEPANDQFRRLAAASGVGVIQKSDFSALLVNVIVGFADEDGVEESACWTAEASTGYIAAYPAAFGTMSSVLSPGR